MHRSLPFFCQAEFIYGPYLIQYDNARLLVKMGRNTEGYPLMVWVSGAIITVFKFLLQRIIFSDICFTISI